MKLHQLDYLCALEQYHSFSKTAERLFISQPALSTSIKLLEKELHCTLLNRNHLGVQFTPIGKIALEKAHDILNEVVLIRSIANASEKIPEKLCIASNTFRCFDLSLHLIRQLNVDNNEGMLNLQELSEHEIIHQLIYGPIDFALLQINTTHAYADQILSLAKEHLSITELISEPLVILVRKNHPLASFRTVSITDLFSYPFVTTQKETDAQLIHAMSQVGFRKEPLEIRDTLSLNQLISESNHWTFIPASEISRHQKCSAPPFTILYPEDFSCICVINWLSNKDKHSPEEPLLLNTIRSLLNTREERV